MLTRACGEEKTELYRTLTGKIPEIRAMREDVFERIIEIDNLVLGKSKLGYWEAKIEMLGKRPALTSLVAAMEDEVVCFILGDASGWEYGVPEDIGWIDTTAVEPAYQKKGCGPAFHARDAQLHEKAVADAVCTLVNRRDWILL
jgi:GNAT superfamily N-acetyltransferase